LVIDATITELRSFIDRALARAVAAGHSAYLLVELDADERARAALAAWTRALGEARVRYAMRSSGSRVYHDRGGNERTEIDEILIEIWPDRPEWMVSGAPQAPARHNPGDTATLAPR
jgi:hypothetical protein